MLTVLLVLVLVLVLAGEQVIVLGGPDVNRFASLTAAASPIVWCGKRIFCAIFMVPLKITLLPRQSQGKHRESTQKTSGGVFS